AFNNHGCNLAMAASVLGGNGGLPAQAFEYVRSAGGLSTEFHYPYKAKTLKCSFKGSNLTDGLHFAP
ncbi:Thiol protease aleurain, partial [Symbiodinium microadriaticum]